MSIGAQVTYFGNALQQRLSTALVWLADVIAFLSRTVWPLVDLLIRIWIGRQALVLSVLISTDWSMAVSMATGSYPIPIAGLGSTALLSLVYWLAAVSLILGLATRVGAATLLALAVASHIRVAAVDLNLFWMALLAYYVLLGADRLSLDRLVSQGLKSSSLPQVGALITVLDAARPALTSIYLLALRVALMLTLLLAGGHVSTVMMTTTAGIFEWLPVSSATLLFGEAGIALALLIGSGLATRATALLAVVMFGYHTMSGGEMSFPFYWTVLLLLLVAKGPGPFSLDGAVVAALRRSLPELSGKPAFSLEGLPRVVIVGAGFGGIACARALRHASASITLIDQQNHHLFQPLLYQVATAGLSPADIAIPIRTIFRDQFNAKVMLATVTGVNTERREVLADGLSIPYDYLVIATGATHSYFGKDAWAPFAPGLKRVEDATFVRRRMLEAFEHAEVAASEVERRRLLTFVIVGGGPTGVELAGAIAELARVGMEKDFRNFDPATAEIILLQAGPRLLPGVSPVAVGGCASLARRRRRQSARQQRGSSDRCRRRHRPRPAHLCKNGFVGCGRRRITRREMAQFGSRQGRPRQGSTRSFRRPPARCLRNRRHFSRQLLEGRARTGTGTGRQAGWGLRRQGHSGKAPWRTRPARLLLPTYGHPSDDRAKISGRRFRFCPVAWRHGLVALGRRPRAVPSRITQPRGSGPELDLVLHDVPRLDATHHQLNPTSP